MSSQPEFNTAETLRLWSHDAEPHMVAPLEQLADQCDREMLANFNAGVGGAEPVVLAPIAEELSNIMTAGHTEAPVKVEPELFACLAAVRGMGNQLSYAVTPTREAADLRRSLEHRQAGIEETMTHLTGKLDQAETRERDSQTLILALKAQLADARGALDILHRALNGTLHESSEVVS